MSSKDNGKGKHILVLGAGLVTRPLIDYLLAIPDFRLTVATRTVSKAEKMIGGNPRAKAVTLNVEDDASLREMVKGADLVISLVPYAYHVRVAKLCLEFKAHFVSTSYVSPEMRALDGAARKAGLLLLNEIGLDPGIDHMSAMKIIHDVERRGGKVVSFTSNCGGLPAPEANTNPWGYKFSWSPRGVVLAARNAAEYLWQGEMRKIPGPELFTDVRRMEVEGLGAYEVYPNRNSMGYQAIYGLDDAQTIFRGTFRNLGHCATWKAIADCGWLDLEEKPTKGMTFGRFFAELIHSHGDLKQDLARFLKIDEKADPIARMEWLGLLSNEPIPGAGAQSPLDVLAARLLVKLPFQTGERDMVILQHNFETSHTEHKGERISSTLIDFGIPNGDSSMARTVSLPAAIAARMILQGKIAITGVHIPVLPEIYNPVLDELAANNIAFKESRQGL